jgi:succinylglutamic semialdehyde dehydrogenase
VSGRDLIGGTWQPIEGEALRSCNPSRPDDCCWSGTPVVGHVDEAVRAAREPAVAWAETPLESRAAVLRRFAELVTERAGDLAALILRETGKTRAESAAEAGALAAKIAITIDGPGAARVTPWTFPVNDSRSGACTFRPHGVMSVIGPFNFPMHLPNGQMAPALLAGNAVVFKPSERAAACGEALVQCWHDAGLPRGVVSLVHGGPTVASELVTHPGVDGVLFTGSWPVGRKILESCLDDPGRIVALELGGNNPAIVMPDADLRQAVIECVRASFATAGQRCTCTRRIIVHEDIADAFIPALAACASTLLVGDPAGDVPVFMGPVISEAARDAVLAAQSRLASAGARVVVPCVPVDGPGWFVTAGVTEVETFIGGEDQEIFGPLVQVCSVGSLDEAIREAAATRYGLAASVFSADRSVFETAMSRLKVGCLNWNTGTAGASSALPFGGVGRSGNHRPAAAFASDFCAYPVASLLETGDAAPVPEGLLWDDRWIDRV